MKMSITNRIALGICAAALLAGCAGSQSPIAPGAMPQSRGLAEPGASSNYAILYSFVGVPNDGRNPYAGLIDVGGKLYGTTAFGGKYGFGTIFDVTTGGTETVLDSFGHGSQGAHPNAGLIELGGKLYGTTPYGGTSNCGAQDAGNGCGTAFSIKPGKVESLLHAFGKGSDGAHPAASLVEVQGKFYGTTSSGGAYGLGTVFTITPNGTEKVIHSFGNRLDGLNPVAPLLAIGDTLYGTTSAGGAYGHGAVFRITTGGAEKVLFSFGRGHDGANPQGGLTDLKGTLYGTTEDGGKFSCSKQDSPQDYCGIVFSITLNGAEKVLHTFGKGTDGAHPFAALYAFKGALYGTTSSGGVSGEGTVFKITPGGAEVVLHSFGDKSALDGANPRASLIALNGTLYSTTEMGGKYNDGTVFSLTP